MTGLPGWMRFDYPPSEVGQFPPSPVGFPPYSRIPPEEELRMLEEERMMLEQEIARIRGRMEELEKELKEVK